MLTGAPTTREWAMGSCGYILPGTRRPSTSWKLLLIGPESAPDFKKVPEFESRDLKRVAFLGYEFDGAQERALKKTFARSAPLFFVMTPDALPDGALVFLYGNILFDLRADQPELWRQRRDSRDQGWR